jgi:hypothetical protein
MGRGCRKAQHVSTVVLVVQGCASIVRISEKCVPRNFLDDIPNESSPLAKVALHARDTGLWLVRGDLLYIEMLVSMCSPCALFLFVQLGGGASIVQWMSSSEDGG